MLHRLSDLLRLSLEDRTGEHLDLESELVFVRHYLDIEKVRFEDRLTVEYDIQSAALDATVPPMLLQPLVENAIRHGIAPRTEGGRLRIAATTEDGRVTIEISDDGTGFDQSMPGVNGSGIGLSNTRRRLRTAFPDKHELQIESKPGQGTTVRITLPHDGTSSDDRP